MQTFDAAVLGLGTMGSFACMDLARRGLRVAGIDQFRPPHDRGSHSGDTRVFRIAYAEHPDYVPLAQKAGRLWNEYATQSGKPLLTQSGMLSMGQANSDLITGIRKSSACYGLTVENMSRAEIQRRFPTFTLPENYIGVFEQTAGWIDVDASIRFALDEAERSGAKLWLDAPLKEWKHSGKNIVVSFENESVEAACLVIAAGAWTGALMRDLRLPLSIRRKVLVWFNPPNPSTFAERVFPVFAIGDQFFYGFPDLLGQGVKVAIHWGQNEAIEDPSASASVANEADVAPVLSKVRQYIPALGSDARRAATCLYTMTTDEHFIVDRHPRFDNVFLAAGFSGHGFKFAPSIGEALADFCTLGKSEMPALFSIDRFASSRI